MCPAPCPTLNVHDLESVKGTLLPLLHHYLPYTVVLYRRLQYHLLYPHEPHGNVISVFPAGVTAESLLERLKQNQAQTGNAKDQKATELAPEWTASVDDRGMDVPWLIAHIDVSHLVGTTTFTFSSIELPVLPELRSEDRYNTLSAETSLQLQTYFIHVRDRLIPTRPLSAPPGWPFAKQIKKLAYKRSIILLGAIHETVLELIRGFASADLSKEPADSMAKAAVSSIPSATATVGGESSPLPQSTTTPPALSLQILRTDLPYLKYIFPRQTYDINDQDIGLPDSLTFKPLATTADFSLVLSRSHIPRSIALLSSFPNIGLYPAITEPSVPSSPAPVAWTFLGSDSSLTSLHVEPSHRGQNLASIISRRLFRDMESYFSGQIPFGVQELIDLGTRTDLKEDLAVAAAGWAHADVHENNAQSRRAMEKLAGDYGRVGWRTGWSEVDLDA